MARKNGSRNTRTGNVLDYVLWRGDLSFAHDRWHTIDSLIAALIAYSNFGENELTLGSSQELTLAEMMNRDLLSRYPQLGGQTDEEARSELLQEMADSARFGSIRMLDQVNDVDSRRGIQFSALMIEVPDTGTVIAYRGTDPSLVGWKEDFMMSYMSPVPAQTAAVAYLKKAAEYTAGPLILTGHSKGGNLAVYAAAHTEAEIQSRIRSICSFDGPGQDDETMESEGYRRIAPLIRSIIPSGSIVGRLMNYHPVYRVVTSTKSSFLQHDPFTWNLIGKSFDEVEDISAQAQLIDKTLHEWIKSCTPEQRERFVTTVFGFFDKGSKGLADAVSDTRLHEATDGMDESSRQVFVSLLYRLMALLVGNTFDARVRQPLVHAAAIFRRKKENEEDMVIKSIPIQIDNIGNGYQAAVAQTRLMAEFNELSEKESLRLQLFAEEMLCMARAVTGEMKATFWIECTMNRFELHLSTETVMDRQKRKTLIASSTARKNEASRSFLGLLRNAFERAMASGTEDVYFDLGAKGAQASGKQAWDHYEQSVLLRLADDVKIDIRGNTVNLTICKEFGRRQDLVSQARP